jgi:hypothetical protein
MIMAILSQDKRATLPANQCAENKSASAKSMDCCHTGVSVLRWVGHSIACSYQHSLSHYSPTTYYIFTHAHIRVNAQDRTRRNVTAVGGQSRAEPHGHNTHVHTKPDNAFSTHADEK